MTQTDTDLKVIELATIVHSLKLLAWSDAKVSEYLNISRSKVQRLKKTPEYQNIQRETILENEEMTQAILSMQMRIISYVMKYVNKAEMTDDLTSIPDLRERVSVINSLSRFCNISLNTED